MHNITIEELINKAINENGNILITGAGYKICGVYKITSPLGKIYIGQSANIKKRWQGHRATNFKKKVFGLLAKSLKEFGIENHSFGIVEECDKSQLVLRERYWQEYYNTTGEKGLNSLMIKVGDYPTVYREEFLEEIRITRKNLSGTNSPHFGKITSKDTKEKLSVKAKQRYKDRPELRLALSLSKRGDKHRQWGIPIPEHQKEAISKKLSKTVINLETGIYYSSAKEVSDLTGIKYSTLRMWLGGKFTNKTPFRYC